MKFSTQTSQAGVSWQELLPLWQELDRASEFDHLWLMDHFVTGMGTADGADGPCLEGWIALAALAQATSRVRLGILVSGNTYRHPAVLAKMATTLDHISDGRLELGIGGAWHTYEHQAFGIPFYTTRERLERLDEAVQLIKLLWTEEKPKLEGRYYQLDGPPYNPPNVQQPHPPIMVAGGGEKRTLRTAAKYGDAMNVSGTPEEVKHKFEVLERHCQEVGTDYNRIRRTIVVPLFLSDDPAFHQQVLQGMAAFRGSTEEEARRGIFLGSVQEIQARVQEYAEVGTQEIIVSQFPRFHRESLLRFAGEVIPAFR
jgi:F420-dependent oxidoreductase-like protein